MSVTEKFFLFAVCALLTCMFVKFVFMTSDEAKILGNNYTDQMGKINKDLEESGLTKYDNDELYGYDIVNCIKENLGDYASTETAPVNVYVKTTFSENTYTNGAYISNIKSFADTKYIKPTATFIGDVIRNENRVIIGLSFIQK